MYQQWEPLPDPDKPNCPYIPGFEVDIRNHVPPPPFGNRLYPSEPRPPINDEWLRSATQTKQVLTYPPLETPPPLQYEVARLTVTKALASGDSRGAQVLVCSIQKPNADPFTAVAKIFDPLYYSSVTDIACCPIEVVDLADGHYSREAAAYEFLQKLGQTGSFAPEYFGSPIRLILIEHLAGACLRDLFVENRPAQIDASHLSVQYRLRALAMLLDGVVRQHHAGLSQRDLAPRNVIILPHPDECLDDTSPKRVVLIDYNISLIWELSTYGKLPFQLAKLPQNPMQQNWKNPLIDFGGWTPPEWCHNLRLHQEWLVQEYGGEKAVLYEPVEEQLEFSE
ncbi:hypothetical protein KVR01_006127 [Diaporthe batatas]|uniref:uncharacterized protein n=1 Tax=Diaporthe batatas TaxID=748121 RepID=UPI001D0533D7|nr:uncharacterized protein KVR01_006127 [Diaporthe batatas]KAG8164209.1 hypothetical protein KVR01_006127 [Diaporthe batatas]